MTKARLWLGAAGIRHPFCSLCIKNRKEEGERGKKTWKKKTGIKISTREMSSEVEGDEKIKPYFFSSSD